MKGATSGGVVDTQVTLDLRTRVAAFKGSGRWDEASVKRPISASETAILICDVWDSHWCRHAAERAGELAVRIDALVKTARQSGIQIIHSPSDTLDFYAGAAQRRRVADIPLVDPPEPLDLPDPPLPIDDSDGGLRHGRVPIPPAMVATAPGHRDR